MIVVGSKKWLRRLELALWSVGLVLFGVAAASTATRWHYQYQQERALFDRGPAVSPVKMPGEPLPHAQSPVAGITTLIPQIAQPAIAQSKIRTPPADPTAIGRIEIPRLG